MAVAIWSLRPKETSDHGAILDLAQTLNKWFTSEGLDEIRRDLAGHRGSVAVLRGTIVGFATWNPIDQDVANLSWMGVAESDHHRGIGTALLAAIVDDVRRGGFQHLEVSTVADSVDHVPYAETRRFYRSRGFRDFRVDVNRFGPPGDRYDRLLLRLDLRKLDPGP